MVTRDEALTALDEVRRWHDTDTRFTDRLDKVKAYIGRLEAALPPGNDDGTEEYEFPADSTAAQIDAAEPVVTDEDTAEIQTIGDASKPKGRKR